MSKAKRIMVQGTMSGAGKSLLCTALCRIFAQDGLRAAPFKSQNMALNSAVTRELLEIGRAQAVQAEAAGIEPDARMNPVLLKPSSDTGSQVIVNGRVRAQMTAAEYFTYKKALIPEIRAAYDSLAAEYDVIVIEGAGSPAEINLRENDIVNMGLAERVGAPVLLAGGDAALLRPGLRQLEALTNIPVLGVVPYLNVRIDDEDSLAPCLDARGAHKPLDVAVIRLPHIANFTDFAPLEAHALLGVRYAERVSQLGEPDLLILPGTKSTMDDLLWLRRCGLEAAVLRLAARGTPVLGVCGGYQMLGESERARVRGLIVNKFRGDAALLRPGLRQLEELTKVPVLGVCGGYQMLGEQITDDAGVEGSVPALRGLGLLPCETAFAPEKTLTRVRARVTGGPLDGAALDGYEIHMGTTRVRGEPFCRLDDGRTDGCRSGNVSGTYLHGLFDGDEAVEKLASWLCERKGIQKESAAALPRKAYGERQYDLLAAGVREALDMDAIYRMMEEFS